MATFTSVPFNMQRGGGKMGSLFSALSNKKVRKMAMDQLMGKKLTGALTGGFKKSGQKAITTTATDAATKTAKAALPKTSILKPKSFLAAAKNPAYRKHIAKKVAVAAGKQALKGAAEVGIDYGVHRLLGGEALNRDDMKAVSNTAGLNMVTNVMAGKKVTPRMVRGEIQRATNSRLATKGKKKKVGKARGTLAERMLRLQTFLNKAQKSKRKSVLRGYERRLRESRMFGTGLGPGKKKKKKKTPKSKRKPKKKKKKKTGKKKKKTTKKKTTKRTGAKKSIKSMNIAASKARYSKMTDIFNI